jgi:hypothetical protein
MLPWQQEIEGGKITWWGKKDTTVLDFLTSTMHASSVGMWHGLIVAVVILLPFPFYWYLWNFPDRWMQICGKGVNPSHRMAQVSHLLKALQIFALLSVATISRPPLICIALLAFGQYLNYRYVLTATSYLWKMISWGLWIADTRWIAAISCLGYVVHLCDCII